MPRCGYWLGVTLYASGDTAGAEREFVAVIRQSPGFANAHFSLGALYEARGRRSEAIDQYRAAVAGDAALPDARLRLADLLSVENRWEDALAQYDAAVKLDPGSVPGWTGGARALRALGRAAEADTWTAQASRLRQGQGR